jgi:hypothetical protein
MRRRRPKKPEAYPERSRIHPYLTARRRRQLDQWVADHGVSESQAVDDAIGVLWETRGGEANVLYQRLDHMSRKLDALSSVPATLERLERQLEATSLVLALFVRGWLSVTHPTVVDGYQRFLAAVAKALLSGRTLLDDLPEKVRVELRARAQEGVAAASSRSPSPGRSTADPGAP